MRTLEASGKTIDEAIFNGLKELEVSIDEVEIDIVQQESKGILGIGAKPAIVRLIEREPEQIVIPSYLTDADRERSGSRTGRGRENGRSNNRRGRHDDRPRRDNDHREFNERRRKEAEFALEQGDVENADKEQSATKTAERKAADGQRQKGENRRHKETESEKAKIEYTLEVAENNEAAEFLRNMLKLMGVEAQVLANISEDEGVRLKIDSSGMGVLIGHRGETLDAIQYLTSLHVNRTRKEKGYTRVTIDAEGYRDRREETLARLARKVASQVRSTGRARTMEPMNPYERRVLHATLQSNPYVTTYSEGEEPNRRVVIAPKGKDME